VLYSDMGAVWMSLQLRAGIIEGPDLAIIEATEITDKGFIVPSLLIADVPTVLQSSKKIIVEINLNIPHELRGIHDIYIPDTPPDRAAIPLTHTWERIGTPYIEVDPKRIVGVIISDKKANPPSRPPMNETTKKLAKNVVDFIRAEVEKKKVPPGLLPFQIGLGGLGGAILNELDLAGFDGIEVHSALLDDSILDLIDAGKIKAVSGCGCYFTGDGLQRFFKDLKKYKEKIILRPMEVVNSPEVIQRLGVIALNTAIELDIYGHVNNSHIGGTHIVAGPSGSIETARNGYISIFMAPSTAKDGNVSAVVPMVPHVDHTEHEVNVVATENGLADLRGLDPKERAREIIDKCAHPDYRPLLSEYLREAAAKGGHEPHILSKAFDFHRRLTEKGTMKDGASKPPGT
jgi:succinyl-CoA:acetate CoA-transferase